jgi:zinc transporter ZupT
MRDLLKLLMLTVAGAVVGITVHSLIQEIGYVSGYTHDFGDQEHLMFWNVSATVCIVVWMGVTLLGLRLITDRERQ